MCGGGWRCRSIKLPGMQIGYPARWLEHGSLGHGAAEAVEGLYKIASDLSTNRPAALLHITALTLAGGAQPLPLPPATPHFLFLLSRIGRLALASVQPQKLPSLLGSQLLLMMP